MRRPRALAVAQAAPASAPSVIQQTDKTVREVIPPWHVIQKKMAEKEAERAAEKAEKKEERAPLSTITPPPPAPEALLALSAFEDVAPPSGVRLSEPPLPVADVADADVVLTSGGEEPALSFKVYTLADLERRSDAPMALSMRASRVAFDGTMSRSSQHAVRVKNAILTFAKAALAWWKTSKMEREPAKIALRQPFDVMGDELELVVRSIDWKKAGVYTGIAVGASLTLLFTVLTAAELTDDLHTNGKANMSFQSTSAVNPPPLAAAPLPSAPVVIAPPAAAAPAAAEETLEIDPPAKKVAAAKKPAPPAKKKLAYRSADDIFKP